ncbi:MAG: phage/plasmid replication protein [Pyrinomonadaceae bacterium]
MIDTVAINHTLARPPNKEHLRSLGWQPRYHRSAGTLCAFVRNEPRGTCEPRLTLSRTPMVQWYLTAQSSLPRLLHGVNVPLLDESEIESSLRLLSTLVEARSGIIFDPDTALVSRVDFAQDVYIGESQIVPTIAKLARVQIPRYDRTQHNDTTIVFRPKGKHTSKRISVYGKLAEVTRRNGSEEEKQNARGIIRLEDELRTKALTYLTEQLNLPSRATQHILTRRVADYVLQDTRQKLQFDAIESATGEVVEKLHAQYSPRRAQALLGFVELRKQLGEDFYQHTDLKFSRRTYFRDLADCRKAGVLP